MVIGGLEAVAPELAQRFGKTALYWADPNNLPEGAEVIRCAGSEGRLYNAVLVSQAEREYISEFGANEFEARLANAQVDPIAIRRPSVIP